MSQQQLSTFGTTTLSLTMLDTDTAGVFTDGSVFPGTGNFVLLLENEYILVLSISGNNFTCTRAYAGTTAVQHLSGTTAKLVVSKEVLENFFGDRYLIGGYASRPTTGLRSGLIYYANDVDLAWYYDGGNWNLWQPIYVPYTHRVDLTGWTQVNAGSSVWTDYNGVLVTTMPSHSGDLHRYWYKTVPSAPYTINAIVERSNMSAAFTGAGIALSDGTKIYSMLNYDNNDIQTISIDKYTNDATFSATAFRRQHWYNRLWLRIQDDNTNLKFSYSYDGLNYNQVFQEARTTFLTATRVLLDVDRTNTSYNAGDEYHRFLAYWET